MNNAAAMCDHEGFGDMRADRERLVRAEPPSPHARSQRVALDVLHDDEIAPGRVGADFIDRANTVMLESGHRAGFTQEPATRLIVGGRDQKLDRDQPVQPRIASEEDLAHAARAQPALEAVLRDTGTGVQAHDRLGRTGGV